MLKSKWTSVTDNFLKKSQAEKQVDISHRQLSGQESSRKASGHQSPTIFWTSTIIKYSLTCHEMGSYILTQVTVFVFWLIVSADSLAIGVQPEFIRPNDQNVMFTCANNNGTKETLETVFRMRLMKLDDDEQWTEVAVLRFDGSIDLTTGNATAVGHLGDVLDSYLVVTWPVAPDDINGRYRCDAIALTSTGDIVTEQSRDVDVRGMSRDLSVLLERLKKSEKSLVGKVTKTMHSAMESSKINILSALNSKIDDLKEYLDNNTAVFVRRPEEVENLQWPAESFTLLMPSAGCPLHPPAWVKGFKKMKAHPDDKFYPMDVPLHLANPHKKNGYIYRQFCSLPQSPERTQPWPAGSYCLYTMLRSTCPTGFQYAEAKVKVLSDEGNFYLYYYPTNSHNTGTYSVSASWFCCRHDGDATSPIDLPVSHPFYLFRHRGRCQEVKGMDVTQDVFMMETVDDVDFDKWLDRNPDFHPDVSFQPYKEDLCYYSRSRD